jgi:hypothetical protein
VALFDAVSFAIPAQSLFWVAILCCGKNNRPRQKTTYDNKQGDGVIF